MTFSDEDMRRKLPRRTLVLVILSAISTVIIIQILPGFPALICSGISVYLWRRGSFDMSRRLTTIGWGIYIVVTLIQIVATVLNLGNY